MKRICMIILVILLIGTSFPVTAETQSGVGIATREELERIADNPNGAYYLTADIDLGGAAWTPIPFSGTLDGDGHTIVNLYVDTPGAETGQTFDENRNYYDTSFAGLFSTVTNAEIRNLRLLNAKIFVDTDLNCFIGAISGYASDAVFRNCEVITRSKLTMSSKSAGVGGAVGFAENCEMDQCTVEAELEFIDTNQNETCEQFLGGVYAAGYSEVKNCTVYMRGYAEIYGYAHNGGIAGMFKLARGFSPNRMLAVRDSSIDAEIRFFEIAPDGKGYCDPLIGRNCGRDCYLTHNTVRYFDFTYDKTAVTERAETCASPSYQTVVTQPLCEEWGYTTYTCEHCGYAYRDDYTLPQHTYQAETQEPTCTEDGQTVYTCVYCGDRYSETIQATGHVPGEWTVTNQPETGKEGQEERTCAVCGTVLETRPIPALTAEPKPTAAPKPTVTAATYIRLEETVIELQTGESAALHVTIEPYNASYDTLRFESSDPSVVRVDYEGHIKALYPGTSVIRVYTENGAEATCSVIVTAAPKEETRSLFSWFRCG